MEHYYSKSKFVSFVGCHKRLWLEVFKKEEKEENNNITQLENGNLVGDLAMNLFGNYYLAETSDNDLKVQTQNTIDAINRGEEVICEAAFTYLNHYCAVDILVKEDDGYSVYEVKSTTAIKDNYFYDLAYQYYVLSKVGLKINRLNLVYINNQYVFDKVLDLNQYFIISDLTEKVKSMKDEVIELLEISDSILDSNTEPDSIISSVCNKYNGCPFLKYCKKYKGIPEVNSVFDLYNNRSKSKQISNKILSFKDLIDNKVKLSEIQKRQVEFALNDINEIYINKEKVKEFLATFKYPLYFFDFETYQDVVPKYDKTKPYQQIPFQYSLHILYEDGRLEHKEFLGDGINNPLYDIVDSMIKDLSKEGSIIAYNDSFEKSRILELASVVEESKEELLSFIDRFIDLAYVFQHGYCYNKAMGGSFSIKSVLPALFPSDEELNYKNLECVHKGDEASSAYLELANMNEEEYNKMRKNLLAYCRLDTLAMVRIYQKLLELINN